MGQRLDRFLAEAPKPLLLGFLGFAVAAIGAVLGFSIDYRTGNPLGYVAFGVVVLGVAAEMLGELIDPRREQGNLDLGGSGVGVAAPVLGDDLLLLLGSKAHVRRETVAGIPGPQGRLSARAFAPPREPVGARRRAVRAPR